MKLKVGDYVEVNSDFFSLNQRLGLIKKIEPHINPKNPRESVFYLTEVIVTKYFRYSYHLYKYEIRKMTRKDLDKVMIDEL